MTCPHCGAVKLGEQAVRCPRCGARVDRDEPLVDLTDEALLVDDPTVDITDED